MILSSIPSANISVIGKSRTMEDLVLKTTESASKFLNTVSDMDIMKGLRFGSQPRITEDKAAEKPPES